MQAGNFPDGGLAFDANKAGNGKGRFSKKYLA
jgi:hypothetical protein